MTQDKKPNEAWLEEMRQWFIDNPDFPTVSMNLDGTGKDVTKRLRMLFDALEAAEARIKELEAENGKLRAALEFYAENSGWESGKRAREVLNKFGREK